MDYFKTLLEREYARLKTGEDNLIELEVRRRIAATAGIDIGISSEKLISTIKDVERTEEDLRVAIYEFEDHHDVKDDIIARLAHHIFSGYEQHDNVTVKQNPDYKGLAQALSEREGHVSCVVHYETSVFDPRVPDLWIEHNVQPGDNVVFYLHNLNGNGHSLEDMTQYIGASVEEEIPQYICDTHEVMIKDGLHMRVASLLLQKLTQYGHNILIQKDGEEIDGKSIMQMITLFAEAGSKLEFKYEQPRTEEEEQQLNEIREHVKKTLSTRDLGF